MKNKHSSIHSIQFQRYNYQTVMADRRKAKPGDNKDKEYIR